MRMSTLPAFLFLVCFFSSTAVLPQEFESLVIEISDSTWLFSMKINGNSFEEKMTYRKIKKVLGKASKVEKKASSDFPYNRRISSGIKDFLGAGRKVKTFYYLDLGIAFRGKNKRNINSVKIYFDTTNTHIKNLREFTGAFYINGNRVKNDLSKAITQSTGKNNRLDDPLACGRRCMMYDTRFKPCYQSVYYHQIRTRKYNPVIELTYFMDDSDIVEAHYYYKL